jgi:hypothetical protein
VAGGTFPPLVGGAGVSNKMLVQVGKGRGFVVEDTFDRQRRLVITAAHCLRDIPPPAQSGGFLDNLKATQDNLLGPLKAKPSISAQCLFVDTIADIAVLGAPVDEQADAYEKLVTLIPPLKIGGGSVWDTPSPASLIALNGRAIKCTARHIEERLLLENLPKPIVVGMSGSPVRDEAGMAIGLISQARGDEGNAPLLIACLPGHLLIRLGLVQALKAEERFTKHWQSPKSVPPELRFRGHVAIDHRERWARKKNGDERPR